MPTYPAEAERHHASPDICAFFESFFAAKNKHHVGETMGHFAPGVVTYTDATFGWPLDGFEGIKAIFDQYMPTWPSSGLSYPTRVLGHARSAVVAFTDTPELFGGEPRILGAVDFEDPLYEQLRTPAETFPTDFKEGSIEGNAAPAMVAIATQLQRAFAAGDAHAAAQLVSADAVYEDMALRVHVLGRADIERYLGRALAAVPFGNGSELRHVVGSAGGGGFEWVPAPDSTLPGGITALEVDADGRISRLTSVYDGRQLPESDRRALVLLSLALDD